MILDSWFCFRCTTILKRAFKRLDLRFESVQVELKYRQHFQRQSFATAAFLGIVYSGCQLATHASHSLRQDALHPHLPSRVVYLSVQAFSISGMCAASVGCLMKSHIRSLEACCWELVWVIVLILNMLACVLRTQQLERAWDDCGGDVQDFILSQEISCLVAPTAFVAACCQMLPVRCIALLPLTCFALSTSVQQVASWTCQPFAGDGAHQGASARDMLLIVTMVTFVLAGLYSTAHRIERVARQQWLTSIKERASEEALVQRKLGKATLARDLKVFRAAGCHAVVSLREDLRVRVGCGKMAASFFGRDVNGISFLDLLDASSRQKVDKVCKRVDGSRIPRSVNATLISKDEAKERCKVLLVFHGQPGRHFLVGIRARSTDPKKRRRLPSLQSVPDEEVFSHDEGRPDVPQPAAVGSASVVGKLTCRGNEKKKKKKNTPSPQAAAGAVPVYFCPDTLPPLKDTPVFDSDDCSRSSSICSLLYSDSSDDDIAGIGNLCMGRETHVQTDAQVGMKDACVETDITRREDNFKCKCCSRPPAPLDYEQREKMAISCNPRQKKRRKSNRSAPTSATQKTTIENIQGNWTIQSQFIGIAQSFMHRLTFVGERCLDATGKCWKLHSDNGTMFLIKGRVWVEGDVLFREGKSGIVMMFQREEEGVDMLAQDNGEDTDNSGSSDDEPSVASTSGNEALEEAEESLSLLEQMVGRDEADTLEQQEDEEHIDLGDDDEEDEEDWANGAQSP